MASGVWRRFFVVNHHGRAAHRQKRITTVSRQAHRQRAGLEEAGSTSSSGSGNQQRIELQAGQQALPPVDQHIGTSLDQSAVSAVHDAVRRAEQRRGLALTARRAVTPSDPTTRTANKPAAPPVRCPPARESRRRRCR